METIILLRFRKGEGKVLKKLTGMSTILLLVVLVGCGKQGTLRPNQIRYKGKILTYGATDIDDVFFGDGIDLEINKDNRVRSISVTNRDVATYNDIVVGDKIEKVRAKYQHELEMSGAILVDIAGTNEVDPTAGDKSDDLMRYTYFYEDGIIDRIEIYDYIYGVTFK